MIHRVFERCHLGAACPGFHQKWSTVFLFAQSSTVDDVGFTVRSFGSEETSIR